MPSGGILPYAEIIFPIIVAVMGLCLGSFATALVYRIPRNISWIANKDVGASRSRCPSCQVALGVFDLVPLFSWLFSGGRCRHCKNKISSFYPVTELTVMILCLAQYYAWGPVWAFAPVMLAVPFLVSSLVIDWEHMILPDDINIALAALSLVYLGAAWIGGGMFPSGNIVAGLVLVVLLWAVSAVLARFKGREALGMGDIKFLPSAGFFIGMAALPSYLAISGILGIATALFKRKINGSGQFPFGPALIISLYIHLILTGLGFDYTW